MADDDLPSPAHLAAYQAFTSLPTGRASLLASRRASKSLPHEARREPRPPISAGFEFFNAFREGVANEGKRIQQCTTIL